VEGDPDIESIMSSVGAGGPRATANNGTLLLKLKPRGERELEFGPLMQSLRQKLGTVPGIRAFIQNPPAIQIGGRSSKAQYQYTLQSTDLDTLYQWGDEVMAKFRTLKGFQDVTSDYDLNVPSLKVSVQREAPGAAGTQHGAGADLRSAPAFGETQVSTI
jgi:HAE1 family hydrophobic/amphiphilic exporter-1